MDSIPFLIKFTWGAGEEHPYTAVLSAEPLRDQPGEDTGLGYGEDPRVVSQLHPLDWLQAQGGKEHIRAICRTRESPGPCRAGAATLVAFLSRPAFSDDDVARVEVRLRRQVGDLPTSWGAVGPYRAELSIRMEALEDGSWGIQYVDLREVGV